jgi:stage II sporulation protein P
MNKKMLFPLKTVILLILAISAVSLAPPAVHGFNFEDLIDGMPGEVYTMVDEKGSIIMRTARQVNVGDEYISSDNKHYRVKSVDGNRATAEYLRTVTLADTEQNGLPAGMPQAALPVQQTKGASNKKIAIYSSHGAESYIKGDGTESKDPGGGILDVADALQKSLEKKGINVIRSREPHTPHDAGAYQRSRRTAEEAIKENPDAVIDVHRDAVPEEEYLEEVEGKKRVQIQLVVGRQNQNMANNRQFAEGLKKQADKNYPGLIKGIFMARGNYNQDMSPRAVLIEVGSHTNDKELAEESVQLFSEVVNDYLYGTAEGGETAGPAPTTLQGAGGTALRAVLWIIFALIIGIGAYLLVSSGGIEQAKERLRSFTKRELPGIFGRMRRGGNNDEEGGNEGS